MGSLSKFLPYSGSAFPVPGIGAGLKTGKESKIEDFGFAWVAEWLYLIFRRNSTTMAMPAKPQLEPGRVYRTREFTAWGVNAPRLAKRLVREGRLVPLAHGLFAHLKRGRFGTVPPSDEELMRVFLEGAPFVFTGSERWNALGLGTTAVFAASFVYNTKRSGAFQFGGRRFILRRVAFPENPPPEWFVVDLLEHADQAGASRSEVAASLTRALERGTFSRERLLEMAKRYATQATQALVASAIGAS